jgi:hypothetical protein
MSPADLADDADKPQNQNYNNPKTKLQQTVFLCEIMQLAAFLCVICAICGRIFTQEYSIYCTKKPQCLPQISQMTQTNPKTITTKQNSSATIT